MIEVNPRIPIMDIEKGKQKKAEATFTLKKIIKNYVSLKRNKKEIKLNSSLTIDDLLQFYKG